ncbi:MAG: protease-4 [Bacteroidia bacterium]|jgi:protease-4
MKQFLKYVLATITGIFLLTFIFFIVFAGIISSSSKKQTVDVKDNSVLHLKLNYQINDRPQDNPFEIFAASLSSDMNKPVGLYDIVTSIEHAKTDEDIKGIFLDISVLGAGYGKLSEIRTALDDFKTSGKFVYAYSEVLYNQTYYFASVADSIMLNPSGTMLFNGMAADVTFLKETMSKLGIEMQVVKRGKFKGAVEPFILDKLSPENRKQITEYVESIYGEVISKISASRDLSEEALRKIANDVNVKTSDDAVTFKLIDQLAYRDEVMDMLKAAAGDEELNLISLPKYNSVVHPAGKSKSSKKIAVVYASGSIVSGNGQADEIGSEKFAKALREARENDDVKAVVLRINSGGGSALASEVIWRETQLLKAVKPLIVSMGDVAASGGYYIACLGDTILAMPSTITGSIGVFGLYPNAEELFGKVGLHSEIVKTSEMADFGRIDRPLNQNELSFLDAMIGQIYGKFLTRVETGRSLDRAHLDTIAEGRVWTGTYAKDLGLIDEFGGLKDAVEMAANKAGIEKYSVKAYPKSDNPFEAIMGSFGTASIKDKLMKEELGTYYPIYSKLQRLKSLSGIQMIIPIEVDLN